MHFNYLSIYVYFLLMETSIYLDIISQNLLMWSHSLRYCIFCIYLYTDEKKVILYERKKKGVFSKDI